MYFVLEFLFYQTVGIRSSVNIESVEYRGAARNIVEVTANVDPNTDSALSFVWYANNGSGLDNVSHVFNFYVNFGKISFLPVD